MKDDPEKGTYKTSVSGILGGGGQPLIRKDFNFEIFEPRGWSLHKKSPIFYKASTT